MLLSINNKIIKIIKSYGITSDYLGSAVFILLCLNRKDYESLDLLDDENQDNLALNVYKDLEIKGILRKTEKEKELFELTTVGLNLINEILEEEKILLKQKTNSKVKNENFNLDFVESWLNLWKNPNGIYYKDGNRSLGISLKDAKTRFIGFLTDYSYLFSDLDESISASEVIINSTQIYLDEQKKVNFAFSKGAKNFISLVEGNTKDTKTSLLASYCEEYLINYKKKNTKESNSSLNAYDNSVNL